MTPRPRLLHVLALLLALGASACTGGDEGGCNPDDADGIIGGNYTFVLTIDDTAFSALILKVQNSARVTLTLENAGTTPHGFGVDCIPTPNDDGCPETSCFPDGSRIEPIATGESATAVFDVPRVEGIYTFRSTGEGDGQTGQFVVQ